jgi:hypothetical protein
MGRVQPVVCNVDGIASVDDEDRLAFVCFSIDSDMAVPEGSQ